MRIIDKKTLAHNGRGVVACVICGLVAIAASLVILPGFMREVVGGKSVLLCIVVCFALYYLASVLEGGAL